MGELAGGILHEFNNILTVVSGTIDILALAAADRPQVAAVVKLIDEAAIRGSRLTSYFQAFERAQPPRHRDVDIGALLSDAERLLRPVLEGRTEVAAADAAMVPIATADAGLLLVAILGLAIAAHGAMPHGGAISLAARGERDDENTEEHVVIVLDAMSHGSVDNFSSRILEASGMAEAWAEQAGAVIRIVAHTSRSASFEFRLAKAGIDSPSLADG